MPTRFAKSIGITEAAERLGLTTQAVRNRIRAGTLPGTKDERGRWRIPSGAVPRAPLTAVIPDSLDDRVAALERELGALREAQAHREADLQNERDRHRADAVAAREVALHLNAAVAEARAAAQSLLNALDAQADALTQLLTPGSPADLK
jgi:excisionase family DNA binding protein